MSISSTSFKTTITTSASTGPFDIPFLLNNSSELQVIHLSTASVESTYSSTQFSVAGTFPSSTGTFSVVSTGDVLTSTLQSFLAKRNVPDIQGVDLTPAGSLPAESIEEGIDNTVMITQQLGEQIARSLTLRPTSTLTNLRIPDPSSGSYLSWSTANTLQNTSALGTTAVSVSTFAEGLLDDTSASGMRDTIEAMGATATVTSNTVPVFNSTTGKVLRASGLTVSTLDQLYGHYAGVSTASTGSFTISSSENGMVIRLNSTSNVTVTIPASSATLLNIGWQAVFCRLSTFTDTFALASTNDTLVADTTNSVFIQNQYAVASLIRLSGSSTASVWLLAGKLSTA